jgi:hypothetical protein
VTRSPGERAKSPLTASVVSGPGGLSSLGRPPVMADVALARPGELAGQLHQHESFQQGPERPAGP